MIWSVAVYFNQRVVTFRKDILDYAIHPTKRKKICNRVWEQSSSSYSFPRVSFYRAKLAITPLSILLICLLKGRYACRALKAARCKKRKKKQKKDNKKKRVTSPKPDNRVYCVFTRSASESLLPVSSRDQSEQRVRTRACTAHKHRLFIFVKSAFILLLYSPRRSLIGGKNSAHVAATIHGATNITYMVISWLTK